MMFLSEKAHLKAIGGTLISELIAPEQVLTTNRIMWVVKTAHSQILIFRPLVNEERPLEMVHEAKSDEFTK